MAVIIGGSNNTILSTTWANKPASYPVGQSVFITDAGTKGSHWFYDGTRWKPMNGMCLLASSDTTSSAIGNSETIVFQYQMPAALMQAADSLRFYTSLSKSGGTDTGQMRIRIGTGGTTSDTLVQDAPVFSATYRQMAMAFDIRFDSATAAQVMPSQRTSLGYSGSPTATTVGFVAPVTISSATSNSLYVNVAIYSNGTTDTLSLTGGQIWLVSKAN